MATYVIPHTSTLPIEELKQQVVNHPVINTINTPEQLRLFMQYHVMCVFDFMSIVKTLRDQLSAKTSCWIPSGNPTITRFMNEIMLDEESDISPDGSPISHFEWYLKAMQEMNADAKAICHFVSHLREEKSIQTALTLANITSEAQHHCLVTQAICQQPVDVVANVFYHTRESIIPAMFHNIVEVIDSNNLQCPWFKAYLERHMECDSEAHGPMAKQMIEHLSNPEKSNIYQHWITEALNARHRLYDATQKAIITL